MFPPESVFLVVDDMPVIRDLVSSQLKVLGYQKISTAENGEKALMELVKLEKEGTPVSCIISDWNMPVVNGLEFLKKIRSIEKYKNLPFILLTSESEKEQVTEAILAGVSQYIVKPFQSKAFEDKLKLAYQKHHKA